MKRIQTQIETDASPEELWAILMDFDSYPTWNPMVVSIQGNPDPGQRLQTTIAMKGGRQMRFQPRVVEYEQGTRFGWLGRLWVQGLFDGLHRFEVVPSTKGSRFVHSEEFRGLLPPLLGRLLRDTQEMLQLMDEALVAEALRRRALVSAG